MLAQSQRNKIMKTPKNYDAGSVASHDLFAPFVNVGESGAPYYMLCMDGPTLLDHEVLTEDDDFTHEWHIDYMGGGIYEIEFSKAPELCTQVYRGKIPTREAFLTIMANVEDAPSWANASLSHGDGSATPIHEKS